MNDIYITLTGNVAAEPRQYTFEDGARVTSLRVLTAHRYFDRKTGQWTDGEKVCFAVRCWRALGDNVAQSIKVGHPVVVSGKLRIREFGPEGDRRFMPEVEASAVGHDLRWGTGVFAKPDRGGAGASVSREMRDRLDAETEDWAMGARPPAATRPAPSPLDLSTPPATPKPATTPDDTATAPSLPVDPAMSVDPVLPVDPALPVNPGSAQVVTTRQAVAATPAPKAGSTRQSAAKARKGAAGSSAAVRILGADDNESESEDAEWPTDESAAA
ncbi:single-stranded DNA-binding protein [Nonomuraea indica]|uniref:Single-stranded DNA-binding protein n=1 Tax=Nonomuraea indica TaxID=1581193 RepID=A0ABW8AF12_9ACTN